MGRPAGSVNKSKVNETTETEMTLETNDAPGVSPEIRKAYGLCKVDVGGRLITHLIEVAVDVSSGEATKVSMIPQDTTYEAVAQFKIQAGMNVLNVATYKDLA